jgi:hypothetical protein
MPFLVKLGPARFRRWIVHEIPLRNVRNLCDVVDEMAETTMEVYQHKMKLVAKNVFDTDIGQGKDIMSLLR